jgi:hypothetical protein
MAWVSENYHLRKPKREAKNIHFPTFLPHSFPLGVSSDTYSELAPFGSSPSEEEEGEESGPKGGEALEVR